MLFISIIVPVFNRKKYIRRCIDSILKQTFKDYEIIIINDGSNDGTEKICDRYGRIYDNIKVIHQKNSGVSKARNEGLKVAEGQYVTFIDSDDYIPSDYLQKISDAYDEYGQEFIYCTSFKVDTEEGNRYFRHRKSTEYSIIKENVLPIFGNGLFYAVINKVYCVSVIKKYGIKFSEGLDLGEDLIFNLLYVDKQRDIRFFLFNKNFYHQCRKKRDKSLEYDWRSNYFQIQKLLLKEKIGYINKWIEEGKIYPSSGKIIPVWYYDCIRESMEYYITNICKKGPVLIIKQMMKIVRSEEYATCVRLNGGQKSFFVKMLYHICKKQMMRK